MLKKIDSPQPKIKPAEFVFVLDLNLRLPIKKLLLTNNVNDNFVCSSHSRTISSILYASVTYPRLEDVCLSKSVSKRDDSRAIANGESENVSKTSTKCTT